MPRSPKTPLPDDMFSEFPAEHDDLWPETDINRQKRQTDAFKEFDAEDDGAGDRWLTVARSQQPAPIKVYNYRHPLAVAAVVLSLFTPAAIVSTLIVDQHLVAARENLLADSPVLPLSLLDTSVAPLPDLRRIQISTPAPRSQGSTLPPAPVPRSVKNVPKAPLTRPVTTSNGVLPLTSAVLSASMTSPPVSPGSARGSSVPSGAAPVPNGVPPVLETPPPPPAPLPASPAGVPAFRVAPSPSSSTTVPIARDTLPESAAVRSALDRYRRGFNELDSGEVRAIWPDVDARALARAFSQLSYQSLVFDTCKVDVKGVLATASCRGRAQYVPKVGSKTPRVELREWTFLLRRGPDDWWIQTVDSK